MDPSSTADEAVRAPRRRRRNHPALRRRRRRRRVGGGLLLLIVVAGAAAAWLGYTGLKAKSDLEVAAGHVTRARAALLAADVATAQAEVGSAAASAADARSRTSDVVWSVASHLPVVGDTIGATRGISAVIDEVVRDVLPPSVRAGLAINPATLRQPGGRLDVGALAAAREPLSTASAAADVADERANAIPLATFPAAVVSARASLLEQTGALRYQLRDASTAAQVMPDMLGLNGPRNYFLAFQTNAEARGTGGLIGGFGILRTNGGTVNLDTLAPNTQLEQGRTPLDLGPEYDAMYRDYAPTVTWVNSNVSPHFPYAAAIWQSLWRQQSGEELDGAVATDPVALSYILSAVGPVSLPDGEVITGDDVVRVTESDAYTRFADDNTARKTYLQSIARAVVDRVVQAGAGSTTALVSALGRAAGEGRLLVMSDVGAEQAVLERTPLGGVVPQQAAPYADVVVNNAAGNKLDYYLQRSISYSAGACDTTRRESTIAVDLGNTAPTSGLPQYVDGRLDPNPTGPPGTMRTLVTVYATEGALLRGATVDGAPVTVRTGVERGHPAFTVDLQIPPGTAPRLALQLVEPAWPGRPDVPVQPLVAPATVSTSVPVCTPVG